jgi:hypothetical protein
LNECKIRAITFSGSNPPVSSWYFVIIITNIRNNRINKYFREKFRRKHSTRKILAVSILPVKLSV